MKLLATGGAGYIGSVVASQLVEAGHDTVVLDDLSKGHEDAVSEGARLARGNLLEDEFLHEALSDSFDGVLHFAAFSLVGEDLGRAHLLALEAAKPAEHGIYNLGNGNGFSVWKVVVDARRVTRRKIETIEAPRRVGDPPELVASSEKIQAELGWKSERSSLEDMIYDAWMWMQANPKGYE